MTFGGNNPSCMTLSMNGAFLPWVSKVKYLGICFLCNTGELDLSETIRKFYSQFNNIMSVLGKGSRQMNAIHLMKIYCLPTLTYGIESAAICDNSSSLGSLPKGRFQTPSSPCFSTLCHLLQLLICVSIVPLHHPV